MLERLLEKKEYEYIFSIIKDTEFLLPFNDNRIVYLETEENKKYIPLFTSEKHLKDLKYTRLDKVKIDVVIRDIYKNGYYAITINPYTDDFIMNGEVIKCLTKY